MRNHERFLQYPRILAASNPKYALFLLTHIDGWIAFNVLGSVFLALTGGEALCADIGHFGRQSIRIDWLVLSKKAAAGQRELLRPIVDKKRAKGIRVQEAGQVAA